MIDEKITIADIAKEAGVGVGTVSRVLNNSTHVSASTREKVLDVIKARQYTPNIVASKLARKDAVETSVGLLLPDLSNHYFFEIFESIYHKFRGLGIDVILFNYEKHNPKVIKKILDAQVSALIIFAFGLDDTERELLQQWHVKYLYVDYKKIDEHSIFTNNISGGSLAANYLIQKRAKRVCYISVTPSSIATNERFAGFKEGLKKMGYTGEVGLYESTLSESNGYHVGLQIIKDNLYDGVFCYCDDIALGVLKAVRESNSSIKVIGFDGVHATRYLKLSTVSQGPQEIGTMAVEILMKIMKNDTSVPVVSHEITPYVIDYNS
jgi:DNA-binding LacI/PurR family transcriptional regulator